MEDLTTYTLVGSLTVTSSKVSGFFPGNVDRYLYKDFGANYFDGIKLNFEGSIDDSDPYGCTSNIYVGFSDVVDDATGWGSDPLTVRFARYGTYGTGTYCIELNYFTSFDTYYIDPDTTYYLTLSRSPGGDTATLKIYSDAARTTLLDTLTVSGIGTTKWQYFFAASTCNDSEVNHEAYGFMQNFLFGGIGGQHRIIGMGL